MARIHRIKNALLKPLLYFLKEKPNPEYPTREKFLVITTTGVGDTLWGLPHIKALKEKYPFSQIDVLTSKVGYALLQHNPDIHELFLLKEPLLFHFFALRKELLKRRFNTVLLFHASQRLVFVLAASLGAKKIIGTKGKCKGLDCILTHQVKDAPHEILRRGLMIEELGATTKDFTPHFYPIEKEMRKAKKALEKCYIDQKKKTVLIHPGAKDFYKCWPAKNYAALGGLLHEQVQILVGGSHDEKALVQSISASSHGYALDPMPLREYACLIKQVDLVITNDTGPMHLAESVQTPVLAFFAPTRPDESGPYQSENAYVLSKRRSCTPCLKRACRDPFCLLQISPKEAYRKCCQILGIELS